MSIKAIVSIAVALLLLYLLFTAGAPFVLALVIAIFLEPITQFFIKKCKFNRLVSSTISSVLFTVLLLGAVALLGVKIVAEVNAFLQRVPQYLNSAGNFFDYILEESTTLFENMPPDVAQQLENWVSSLTSSLASMAASLSKSVLSFATALPELFVFFIVFMVAVFMFSYSLNTLKQSFLTLFEEKSHQKVDKVLQNLRKSIFGFIRSQFILSAMTYLLALAGLLILNIKFPMAIALLIVIVDILPILGTGSVLVPWASYQLLTGDVFTGIGLIILFLVITVVRRIVEPKVLGDSVGIGALPALISLYVGFKLVGVIGVFLGPIVVIIYMAARQAGLFQAKIKLE
ncbi:sporulation integral membrane protein YtvI [Paenibacillus yanchengensis]|uniref:Sporulation integral membrane protein YtvI n=1 Tax=Paenibacillus yanchengensis TaxID=2035833 RepID=A0ABW4YN76_9BACL